MQILANEFVFPIEPGLQCHANYILPLPDGRVFCVFFYGSAEGNDDVRIFGCMRSTDGQWSHPEPLSENDGIPHWNPVLFRRSDGAVLLFYKVGKTISHWITRCRISRDNCASWEPSFELVPGDQSGGRGPVRNKPLCLSDGSILAPGSTEQGEWKCFFDRSRDGGCSWQRTEDIRLPQQLLQNYSDPAKHGIIQPSLWESSSGIHALLRSSEGFIFRTDSIDGASWSSPHPLQLPNNNSGLDLAPLSDGRIILCCNPVAENWGSRTPISLYLSEDDGQTFRFLSHLNTTAGSEFSYPSVQYHDGNLHISYTWNRKTIAYVRLTGL